MMRIWAIVITLLISTGQVTAFDIGDLVVAREALELRKNGEVRDTIGVGQIVTVHRTDDERLWVSRGKPGWINANEVLSLTDAEAYFDRPFATGANAGNYQIRGSIRIALGKQEEGLADLQRAVELSNDSMDRLEPLAYAQLKCQLHRKAIESFTKVISAKPEAASALMGRGLAFYQAGQFERSEADFELALTLEPDHSFPRKYYAAILHDSGRLQEALLQLDAALQMDPFDVFARKARGRLLFDFAEYERALADFQIAVKGDPLDIEAVAGNGVIRHALGTLASAESDFLAAIKLAEPTADDAFLWSNLGQVRMELGSYDRARKDFAQAIKLDANFFEAMSHRAYLNAIDQSSSLAQVDQAKKDLRRVLASTGAPTYWDLRAVAAINARLGDFARAARFQQAALKKVKQSGPKRFVSIAEEALKRYRSELAN